MRSSLSESRAQRDDDARELAERLVEVDAPTWQQLEVRDMPLASRLRRRRAHRAVPAAVGVAAAVAYARAAWLTRVPARARACSWAETLLPGGSHRAEVDRVARRHLIEWTANSELAWRPWLGGRMRVHGMEHLDTALRAGRGAIVGLPHFGPQMLLVHALCARGLRPYLVAWGARAGVLRGADGAWREFQRRHREQAGSRTVSLGDGFPVARALLERGELLLVAWDVHGDSEVELLGRRALVRAGAARLAAATGAPLLPALAWREGATPRGRIGAPLEPAGDPKGLLDALAADFDAELRTRLAQAHPVLTRLFRDSRGPHDARSPAAAG